MWNSDYIKILIDARVPDAVRSVLTLAACAGGKSPEHVLAHGLDSFTEEQIKKLGAFIERRSQHEPVAYIIGKKEFYGLDFFVNSHVLIPRPETEKIVDLAIRWHAEYPTLTRFRDVGTGSGALAIAIKHSLPNVHMAASDVSDEALHVARKNAAHHNAEVEIFRESLLSHTAPESLDVVVANLPYIPKAQAHTLDRNVVCYEPHQALFGGETGTELIEQCIIQAKTVLSKNGCLILEVGYGQSDYVTNFAKMRGFLYVNVYDDISGIARTIMISRGEHSWP